MATPGSPSRTKSCVSWTEPWTPPTDGMARMSIVSSPPSSGGHDDDGATGPSPRDGSATSPAATANNEGDEDTSIDGLDDSDDIYDADNYLSHGKWPPGWPLEHQLESLPSGLIVKVLEFLRPSSLEVLEISGASQSMQDKLVNEWGGYKCSSCEVFAFLDGVDPPPPAGSTGRFPCSSRYALSLCEVCVSNRTCPACTPRCGDCGKIPCTMEGDAFGNVAYCDRLSRGNRCGTIATCEPCATKYKCQACETQCCRCCGHGEPEHAICGPCHENWTERMRTRLDIGGTYRGDDHSDDSGFRYRSRFWENDYDY
jgi:hypothetical protein